MRIGRGGWFVVLLLGSCVQPASTSCREGDVEWVCPEGAVCARVLDAQIFVAPDQLGVCAVGDLRCSLPWLEGACHDGVCLPIECGNGRVDPDGCVTTATA